MLQFPLGVLSFDVCKCIPCCEDRPGRMGRTCLWRSFSRQICVRICRCHIQVVKMRGRDRWLFLKYFLVLSQFKLEMIHFDWLISFSCWVVQPTRRHFVASLSTRQLSMLGARWSASRCWSWEFGFRAWCVARWWEGRGCGSYVLMMVHGTREADEFLHKRMRKKCLRR